MESSRLRRLISISLHATTAIVVCVVGMIVHAASDTTPDPTRELHEAARSYYLAVDSSKSDLDRALTLLRDALDRLEHVTGDAGRAAVAGELAAHARSAVLTLEARHRRLAEISRNAARSLDGRDPQAALDQLSRVPPCPLDDANASWTIEVSAKDCRPKSDAHFDLTGQQDRAQQDVTAAYTFVRQGDSAVRKCADGRGALTAYRRAQDRNGTLVLGSRIAAARSCGGW